MKKGVALWLIALPLCLLAQQSTEPQVSLSVNNLPLAEIFDQMEDAYNLTFYYQTEDLPSGQITLDVVDQPISSVLNRLLRDTPLGYLAYSDDTYVIMPGRIVDQVYTADYYKALEKTLSDDEQPAEEVNQTTIGNSDQLSPSGRATVTGMVTDKQTGEPIIGATIFHPASGLGVATDVDGSYELELPTGEQEIQVQFVGYQSIFRTMLVLSNGTMNVSMANTAVDLSEVVVKAEAADANIGRATAGVEQLDIESIKKLPSFLGEADVVKSLLLLPGVSTIGEGATGFNVRGGEVDQNLIQQDDGFIFNSSHALGFFSTFNTDLIQSVELYKGNIPAQFGGRLASAMDVKMRDGSFEKFGFKGSVSPISSKISVETPVIKGKSSIIGGFRSSYLNYLLPLATVPEVERSSAFFYDANLRYTHRLNDKHIVTFSGYSSFDDFVYNEEFGFEYSTIMGQFTYRTLFSDELFNRFTAIYNEYESTQEALQGVQAAALETGITYWKIRDVLSYTPSEDMRIDAGFDLIRYGVDPGSQRPLDNALSEIATRALAQEQGLEAAVFANIEYALSPAFLISAGIRLNNYAYLGPETSSTYENMDRPEIDETTGEESFESGERIASYNSLEPRISMRYRFNATTSVKGGYSRTAQFINQIFNTAAPTPVNQWKLSDQFVEPMRSHNYTVGVFRNFKNNSWETSLEVYYRDIDALFDFKDFADLNVNDQIETELLNGEGRSYGVELSLKKREGLLNGWFSYTYSRAERLVSGINRGTYYPSNFDIPHNASLVVNIQPNQRHTLTFNFNYSRGRPTTYPLGNYEDPTGLVVPLYSDRNQLRIPDYHRLDIAYTVGQGYNKTKRVKTSWTFSVYNVYGRENAFSVFFTEGPFQRVQANRLAILGSVFPSVTINFEFL